MDNYEFNYFCVRMVFCNDDKKEITTCGNT